MQSWISSWVLNREISWETVCYVLLGVFLFLGCENAIVPRPRIPEKRPVSSTYTQIGIASWYGKEFHREQTASGERYNMYAMTAAHRILPMNTWVRVINLENGNDAVVRINDRGPFIKNRIIDLSYAAAKKLGIVGPGTVPVKVIALGQKLRKSMGEFYLQIGSFSVRSNARDLYGKMKEKGYTKTRIQKVQIREQIFWRVQVGGFINLNRAKRARENLRVLYPNAFIVAVE